MRIGLPPAPPRRVWPWLLGLAVLFAANVTAQFWLSRGCIDNSVINACHPTAHDAHEYVRAAEAAARGTAFGDAFGSAWRMPGYSLFLSLFYRLWDEPLRVMRIVQIFLTAAMIPLSFGIFLRVSGSRRRALFASAVIAGWPPLYHFSTALYAEAASLFLMATLLALMARAGSGGHVLRRALLAGILIAGLAYLKPNHVLLLLPSVAFILATEARKGWRAAAVIAGVAALSLAPWSAFASRFQDRFVPLSTVSGYNLYLGTGVPPAAADDGSLPFRVARATGLTAGPETLPHNPEDAVGAWRSAAWSAEYGRKAMDVWKQRPVASALHGTAKVLHAFGFSFRGARDGVLAGFFLAAMAAAGVLWRNRRHRNWALFLWLSLLTVALQAFAYLPNQRLKTVLFDLPALIVIVLGAFQVIDARVARRKSHAG